MVAHGEESRLATAAILALSLSLAACGGSDHGPITGDDADAGTGGAGAGNGGTDMPDLSMLGELHTIAPADGYPTVPPDGRHSITDVAAAQTLAGGTALDLPRGRYTHGGNRIVSSGNTLIAGPRVGHWDRRLPEFTCTGRECASNPPETAFSYTLDILATFPKVVSTVMEKNGIALLQTAFSRGWETDSLSGSHQIDSLVLMSDVAVADAFYETGGSVDKATGVSQGEYALYGHNAGGFAAGTNLSGDAMYEGLMVGSVVEKDGAKDLNVPNWVVGDAALTFDLAALELDATFSNIVGLTGGQTFDDLAWTGISVNDGAFKQVVAAGENYIEGAFFGVNQEGTAGVFEQGAIHGSFAAMDPAASVDPGLTDVDRYALEDLAHARSAAGGDAPDFTAEDYATGVTELFREADVMLAGDRNVSWGPDRTRRGYECTGRVCMYDDGYETFTQDLNDFGPIPSESSEAVMRKNDIKVVQFANAVEFGEGLNSGYNVQYGLALWGEENVAWTDFNYGYLGGGNYQVYESRVAGEASGSNPSGSATYTGVMAGSVVEKDMAVPLNTPEWVMGDAELMFDIADVTLGATFTNIASLATGESHADLSWSGVPVTDGGFDDGPEGDYLRGAFFGAGHEEVAGTFEQNSISGVFSAAQ